MSIRFLIPLVFMSGFLALVARQLRNNVKWSVQWMKVTAQKAVLAASAEELAYDKQMREENLADAFCRIAANSGKKTVSLAELGPLIERISNKQNFVVQLADLLKIEASMVELDYRAFRGFCSIIAQRTAYAKMQVQASRAYRDVENQCLLKGDGAKMDAAAHSK